MSEHIFQHPKFEKRGQPCPQCGAPYQPSCGACGIAVHNFVEEAELSEKIAQLEAENVLPSEKVEQLEEVNDDLMFRIVAQCKILLRYIEYGRKLEAENEELRHQADYYRNMAESLA